MVSDIEWDGHGCCGHVLQAIGSIRVQAAPYSTAASSSSPRRPRRSPKAKAPPEPASAPSRLDDTTVPLWKALRLYLAAGKAHVSFAHQHCTGTMQGTDLLIGAFHYTLCTIVARVSRRCRVRRKSRGMVQRHTSRCQTARGR